MRKHIWSPSMLVEHLTRLPWCRVPGTWYKVDIGAITTDLLYWLWLGLCGLTIAVRWYGIEINRICWETQHEVGLLSIFIPGITTLTHWGLVMTYGVMELGQHWFRYLWWPVVNNTLMTPKNFYTKFKFFMQGNTNWLTFYIQHFQMLLKKHLKMLYVKCQPLYSALNVLMTISKINTWFNIFMSTRVYLRAFEQLS